MIDITRIKVKAGNGGPGGISFRREKFVPRGGPDGGDGGRGGDVLIRAIEGVHLLRQYRYKRLFNAPNGSGGKGRLKTGGSGKSIKLDVPIGTLVWKINNDGEKDLIADLSDRGQECLVARGGESGKGNARYVSSTNREPLLAENGEKGEEVRLELEMKLIADVGIVGNPSVGKSSLLRACSEAKPEVAAYPFTTLEPVLGYVEGKKQGFVAVEVPGLIEGAHKGVGLGLTFLRHVERTRILIHLLDGTANDCLEEYNQVREEMRQFNYELIEKPHIIVVNKVDLEEVALKQKEINSTFTQVGLNVLFISAKTRKGIDSTLERVQQMLGASESETTRSPLSREELAERPPNARPLVREEGEVFVVEAEKALRIVSRVDLSDRRVQIQLWSELERLGVVRALEKAGAGTGCKVRIGEKELEWE